MKKILFILLTGLILLSCSDTGSDGSSDPDNNEPNDDSEKGTVTVNLSGVPFSTEDLTKINLRISEIWADVGTDEEDDWIALKSFDPGLDINLLDYLGENALVLAEEIELSAGQVNQIRLILDAPDEDENPETSYCYLYYDDGAGNTSTKPLVIPSGSSSGLKGVGEFTIPRNGSVDITVNFDARRFVETGNGMFKLKPVLWVIAENEAGTITGTVGPDTVLSYYPDLSIYAYESGQYDSGQLDPDNDGIQFPDAVYNCFVDSGNGSYTLPYLAAGSYDLVLAYMEADEFVELQIETGIELDSGESVQHNIVISPPSP